MRRDLSKYNEGPMGGEEDLLLDNGWKTVAMDVFRKPAHPMLLSAIIGWVMEERGKEREILTSLSLVTIISLGER